MTNREQAKLTRNAGLNKFLADNAPVFAANPAFSTVKTGFDAHYAALLISAAAANPDNTGYSQEKLLAKTNAAALAATLAASAQVKLESMGKFSIAAGLHDAETYYTIAADALAAAHLQEAHDIMNTNLADLAPDYVTAAELTDLQSLINTFSNTQGSSQEVRAVSPTLTAQFKSDLKAVDKDVTGFLKLGKKFKTTNSTFYNGLVAQCQLPAINIHHTTLQVTVADKQTGAPLTNAAVSLSNSSKTGASDSTGFLEIDNIAAGNPTLTITADGYKNYQSLIHILSGHENDYRIFMEKV